MTRTKTQKQQQTDEEAAEALWGKLVEFVALVDEIEASYEVAVGVLAEGIMAVICNANEHDDDVRQAIKDLADNMRGMITDVRADLEGKTIQ